MKLIIAGSRCLSLTPEQIDAILVQKGIYSLIKELVHGGAIGIDTSADDWYNNLLMSELELAHRLGSKLRDISIKVFKPDYEKYSSKIAPVMRNKEMAEYSDVLLLIWDGKSRGSANMKKNMIMLNKPVLEVIL
jgi:hypothetical protein